MRRATKKLFDEDRYVGDRIRVMRLARKISQSTLAEAIGVTFQQVQKYELGVNRLSIGRLIRVAHVLQVPITDLLPKSADDVKAFGDPLARLAATPGGQRMALAHLGITDATVRACLIALAESIIGALQKKPPRRAGAS
jgi:transcriptional regulator with XRE-family HTH domain